ncbi:MAG TPA: iron chelate uptake ABC transporter family permease subunit [Clostridia bacterium]|nr:iron chelate uptake ABC transporter family permease subunit [Clostridia bacterium]
MITKNNRKIIGLYTVVLFVIIILASTIGVADITFSDALRIISSKIPFIKTFVNIENIKASSLLIVLNIRLPRIILAGIVGVALASSGVVFQAIFKNPMADPYILGISSGAAFGATLVIIFGISFSFLGLSMISIGAFLGAMITTFLVYNIAKLNNRTPVITLLLSGIAISFFLSAFINLLMTMNNDQVEKIVFWTMGSVSAASWKSVAISILPVTIGVSIFVFFSKELNVILMGEETAQNLGINVETIRKLLLGVASIVSAAVVAVSGIIGFVGLIVPHAMRMIVGPDHKRLFPYTIISGAVFMIVADTISRIALNPTEIPIGVITSLIGAPYFIFLLVKNKKILS